MAKLSRVLKKRLETLQSETVPHFAAIIVRKENNCPNLPDWFLEKSVDYYRGLLDGAYSQIENILHDHNQYGGFNELDLPRDQQLSLRSAWPVKCRFYFVTL